MKLQLYTDRMSQPSRAVLILCKASGIDFEEIKVEISKRQQLSPEFEAINPFKKLPAIVDGRFKLFESSIIICFAIPVPVRGDGSMWFNKTSFIWNSEPDICHAILIYIASAFPGVANHWYPADLTRRAKIHSVLDWHHLNLRQGAAPYILHTVLAPVLGLPSSRQAAAEAEKILTSSLSKIESIWLKGNGRYLLGSFQPSIADLSMVCEIMQLELLDEKDRDRILGPHKKVQQWIESTRNATKPHFDEVHNVLYKMKLKLSLQRSNQVEGVKESRIKTPLTSKI
ncbi:hypothetical protein Lal_00013450 [Lupinus albus]|uniref:glutathione transferase n=1 Tax=Lupinus albus TaxID=3870 RepID=A0A6A5LPP1_LUPAL|nr:putative glutathione transferase [Lupinus albus]KAF1862689.1 hypothetical protein Lal_00013450 [Lupinus albus]